MPPKRGFWNWCILLSLLFTVLAAYTPQPARAQTPGENLLVNGDFEAGGATWPLQDGIPEVQVAPGWRGYYVDNPPSYAAIPYPCMENPSACSYWRRPEFRDVKASDYANRVHQGARAQKYFTFNGQHEAGLYQQVSNITPGAWLRFTAHMMTWSCMPPANQWNQCPTGHLSNSPAPMHTKVGIDPTGGTNPWASTVIWSQEVNAIDNWTLFAIEAQAVNSTVTVFTYSRPDWYDYIFRVNNDVYVDTTALVVIGETPPAPPPAQENPPAAPAAPPAVYVPNATATPLPDGTIVHTVSNGDTLFAIALDYNVPPEQITTLNNITNASILAIGQQLIISKPGGGVAATVPQATTAPPVEITAPITLPVPQQDAIQIAAALTPGRLCVLAYQDHNTDGVQQPDETLLPGITFLVQGNNQNLRYTTSGLQEPFCFTDLPAGQYQVTAQGVGYAATVANAYMVAMSPGAALDLALGFSRDTAMPDAVETDQPDASSEATQTTKPRSNLAIILGALGVICLLGALGVGFFVLRR